VYGDIAESEDMAMDYLGQFQFLLLIHCVSLKFSLNNNNCAKYYLCSIITDVKHMYCIVMSYTGCSIKKQPPKKN